MNKKEIEKLTFDIGQEIAKELDVELHEVEYVKEAGYMYLRIFINNETGITLDHCQDFSRELGKRLDELDPIEENYFLEVSSLGLDRPLKTEDDIKDHIGDAVEISLYKKIEGKKRYIGELVSYEDDKVVIIDEDDEQSKEFEKKDIGKIKLSVVF